MIEKYQPSPEKIVEIENPLPLVNTLLALCKSEQYPIIFQHKKQIARLQVKKEPSSLVLENFDAPHLKLIQSGGETTLTELSKKCAEKFKKINPKIVDKFFLPEHQGTVRAFFKDLANQETAHQLFLNPSRLIDILLQIKFYYESCLQQKNQLGENPSPQISTRNRRLAQRLRKRIREPTDEK